MRIAAIFGIKDTSQSAHGIEIVLGELFLHEVNFFNAYSVLAGDATPEFDAFFQNVVARGQRRMTQAPQAERDAVDVVDGVAEHRHAR